MRIAGLAVAVLTLGSCTTADPGVSWHEVALPAPDAAVRDVAFCDGHWYVVGGLPTGPAAWRSTDAKTWSPVRLTPVSFYGEQSTLSTVACRGSDVIAVGAASGGAHGNPRTSTWRGEPDGSWLEREPEFTMFGGPESVGVGAAAAGPAGWAIVGNWLGPDGSPGPAVWHSTDGATFTRELIPEPGRATDIAPLGAGWLVVGEVYGASHKGAAWTSAGGVAWSPTPIQDPLALVTPYGDGALAVGPAGAWRYDGTAWHRRGGFDANDLRFLSLAAAGPRSTNGPPSTDDGLPSTGGSSSTGDGLPSTDGSLIGGGLPIDGALAVTTAGADRCRLWMTHDGGETWRELAMPAPLPMTAETVAAVAVNGDTVLLATDDGTKAHLHTTVIRASPK